MELLARLKAHFPLKEIPVGEFRKLKIKGMTFTIRQYEAAGLGNVSWMNAAGFFGLMKMESLIVNPKWKDMPLLSYDRVKALGRDTLIIELTDTLIGPCYLKPLEEVKARYRSLPDHDLGSHWYDSVRLEQSVSKKGKKALSACFDALTDEYLDAYAACAEQAGPCAPREKAQKSGAYAEGLLLHGGPSTDVFKKGLGEEKTADLFRRVLFG